MGWFSKKDEEPAVYEIVDPNLGGNSSLSGTEYKGASGKIIAEAIVEHINDQRSGSTDNPTLSVRKRR
jgi:hypothetical protein